MIEVCFIPEGPAFISELLETDVAHYYLEKGFMGFHNLLIHNKQMARALVYTKVRRKYLSFIKFNISIYSIMVLRPID